MGLFNTSLCHYTGEVAILSHSTDGVTSPSKNIVFSSEVNGTKNFKHHEVIWFYRIYSPEMQVFPLQQLLKSLLLSSNNE